MPLSREAIISLGSKLTPSVQVFGRLGQLLEDVNNDVDQVVGVVRLDQTLTFQVIKLSNSVMFGIKGKIESLDEAVNRIGFGEVHRLVGLAASHQVFQGDLHTYGLKAARLWENSIACAAAAEALACRAGRDTRALYAAGLLRSIGRVIIDKVTHGPAYPGEQGGPAAAWEKSIHGLDTAEVGALLLDHWRFPAEFCASVRRHYEPAGDVAGAAAVLNLAAGLAEQMGAGLNGETAHWEVSEDKLECAGLSDADLKACRAEAEQVYLHVRGAFAQTLKAA
jgi:HD-like signal output (HDOD) protein